ncbi:MAG: ABC transporter ATP-binding protein [Malacoplasma sp.]
MNNEKYKVQLKNITKTFLNGKIIANENVNLKIKENEIHALIGENGAGKSTLMSILFGLYEQDEGSIFINGEEVKFVSAKDAHKYKIGMVHQHFKLVDDYTVFQNVILGAEKIFSLSKNTEDKMNDNAFRTFCDKIIENLGIIEKKESTQKLLDIIKLYNLNLDLNKKISRLSVGEQQKVEILKLLFLDSEILIFDEPTAVLSDNEITSFLKMIKHFKSEGKTIIIISHKLNELKEVADFGTVLRHGKVVGNFDVKKTDIKEMAELMVGRSINVIKNNIKDDYGKVILSVKDLPLSLLKNSSVKVPRSKWLSDLYQKIEFSDKVNKFKKSWFNFLEKSKLLKVIYMKKPEDLDFSIPSISFDIKEGEIFAIAGVQGNGQSELINYISGMEKSPVDTIKILSRVSEKSSEKELVNISNLSVNDRYKQGMSYIPEDRHKHGLILDDTIAYNSVMNFMYTNKFSTFGFLNFNAINNHALNIIQEFDVRGVAGLDDDARGLSGGNQQKLIVGREIIKDNKFIIFSQPTRGLDVGAIEYIHSRILELKKEKKAILLISYELDEILNLADTIAVINKYQFIGCGDKKDMTRSKIGMLIANQGKGV